MKIKAISIITLAFAAVSAFAQTESVPKYLELARELVATVKPENNMYAHGPQSVHWKGDLFASESSVHAACGGFVRGVLERAKDPTIDLVRSHKKSILLVDWVDAVKSERGVKKVDTLFDVQPGDFFVFICLIKDTCKTSQGDAEGHITIVDIKPEKIAPKAPILEGTDQWNLTVIDSADSAHDRNDTRFVPKGDKKITGVGRGSYRIYTDHSGVPVGYAIGFGGSKFNPISERPITIARPKS